MDDWSEFSAAMRQQSQDRRASNRQSSATLLEEKCVSFESRNDGAHLIVQHGGHVVDFWPGTGKYVFRPAAPWKYKRGVFNLLKDLGVR